MKRAKQKERVFPLILILVPSIPLILHFLGFALVVPLTDSMEPTVHKFSLVLALPTWLLKPSVGDVVLFKVRIYRYSFLVLHRVVGATSEGFLTKGDNRLFRDPWIVRPSNIVGVAVASVPYLGITLLVLRPFLFLAVAWVVSYELVRRWLCEKGKA